MKVYFNLIDPCILRHQHYKLFDHPAGDERFFKQWGYCCNKCRMNSLYTCMVKTCEEMLTLESKYK